MQTLDTDTETETATIYRMGYNDGLAAGRREANEALKEILKEIDKYEALHHSN